MIHRITPCAAPGRQLKSMVRPFLRQVGLTSWVLTVWTVGCARGDTVEPEPSTLRAARASPSDPTSQNDPKEDRASDPPRHTTPNERSGRGNEMTSEGSPSTSLKSELMRTLKASRRGGKTRVDYRPPSVELYSTYGTWIAALAIGSKPNARPPGFEASTPVQALDATLKLVTEKRSERRGAGALLLRPGHDSRLVIEAPHTFFDTGTLDISLDLFIHLKAGALLINTVHRARSQLQSGVTDVAEAARAGTLLSDVAHRPNSLFTSAHKALQSSWRSALFVQIHGFTQGGPQGADLVGSAARTAAQIHPIATHLSTALPNFVVVTYPDQTRKLGGTQNAQANSSRRAGRPFVHLELSRRLRNQLRADSDLAQRFADALAQGIGGR